MRNWLNCLAAILLFFIPTAVRADVVIAFYSHEFGSSFPHGFITMKGKLADGTNVDSSYGFTAKSVTPALLAGSVKGIMETPKPKYIAKSDRQFEVQASDSQYHAVIGFIEKWRSTPGKSYNLGSRNCLHFVGGVAEVLGLKVQYEKGLMKKPRSFLRSILGLNPVLVPLIPQKN